MIGCCWPSPIGSTRTDRPLLGVGVAAPGRSPWEVHMGEHSDPTISRPPPRATTHRKPTSKTSSAGRGATPSGYSVGEASVPSSKPVVAGAIPAAASEQGETPNARLGPVRPLRQTESINQTFPHLGADRDERATPMEPMLLRCMAAPATPRVLTGEAQKGPGRRFRKLAGGTVHGLRVLGAVR